MIGTPSSIANLGNFLIQSLRQADSSKHSWSGFPEKLPTRVKMYIFDFP